MITLDPTQLQAVSDMVGSKFRLLQGGAGTGKTTLIKQAIADIIAQGGKPALCAISGKAAARLREATGYAASTIHSLLQSNGITFRRETLSHLHIIIDEASMVDSWIMYSILTRQPKAITLVGDVAQLTPVGVGAPFHDLINLRPDLTSNLTTCYRSQEAVCDAGHKIRHGLFPQNSTTSRESFTFIPTGNPEDTQHYIIENLIKTRWLDFKQDIILCPKNGKIGPNGVTYAPSTVKGLNQAIVAIVNPRTNNEKWKVGDRIYSKKNFSQKDIWNGTTGTIKAIDSEKQIWITTDMPVLDLEATEAQNKKIYRNDVLFTAEMIREMELAYALTVHKSQGSQYRNVVFTSLDRDTFQMLDRSLIYTAVTRTQHNCIVCGNRTAFAQGITRQRHRKTIIQQLATS